MTRVSIGFPLQRQVIGLKNRDSFAQVFPRLGGLHVVALSFDWLTGLSESFVVGHS